MKINIFDRLNELKVKYAVIKSYACIHGGDINDEYEPTYSIVCHKRDFPIVRTLHFSQTDDYADVIVRDFTETNHQDFNENFDKFTMVLRNEYGAVYEPKGAQSFAEYYKTIDAEDARALIAPKFDSADFAEKFAKGASLSAIATEYMTSPAQIQYYIKKYCTENDLYFNQLKTVSKINELRLRDFSTARIALYLGMSEQTCRSLINKYKSLNK